jgi:hypothetical protein
MTGSKGGIPAKKREVQQATIAQNERITKDLEEQLKGLHKYQDDPDSLQEAIDTTISQISILKDSVVDLKTRIKADEDTELETKARKLNDDAKKAKKTDPEEE